MKANLNINRHPAPVRARGMTLLDVLLAIVIFVIGMLALAHLQTNLTRSSADSNARTIATNIGEELIERLRSFERVRTDPDGVIFAYADIDSAFVSQAIPLRSGLQFDVTGTVWGYNFIDDNELSEPVEAVSGVVYDLKRVDLTIAWTGPGSFRVDESTEVTDADLGTGQVRLTGIIPSTSNKADARLAVGELKSGTAQALFDPGDRPDIIRISLGGDKFKESKTPQPVVVRDDRLVETWFDVVTYSQLAEGGNIFLRREEFVAISCECTLRPSTAEAGLLPTVWTGTEYREGELATKQYGESASNQQSMYCDVCCRDHHDAADGDTYRPWLIGDQHQHYARDTSGNFTVAEQGEDYIEACRLVRKDGFFRVAPDFKMESQVAFPRDFLESESNAESYSGYVIDVAQSYFDGEPPPTLADRGVTFEGDTRDNRLVLPSIDPVAESRQLMSRAVYTDVLSSDLSDQLRHCFPIRDAANCKLPEGLTELEVLPFFDIQTTKLARWVEDPFEDPIDVTNMDFSNQGYERGMASLAGSEQGISNVTARMEKSNTGLIDTLPIALLPDFGRAESVMFMQAGDGTEPPDGGILAISGRITAAKNTSDAGVARIIGNGDLECVRPAPGEFECYLPPGGALASRPHITVTNYFRNGKDLVVCSNNTSVLAAASPSHVIGETALENRSFFDILSFGATGASLTINLSPCP